MPRSLYFARVMAALRRAETGTDLSDSTAMVRDAPSAVSRRSFVASSARGGLALASTGLFFRDNALGTPKGRTVRIAIVGGGLAGLVCADTLQKQGHLATIYEANPSRLGGRCFSNRNLLLGHAAENGGEFIDTGHKTMLRYANELGLRLEDVTKAPGELAFHFFGQRYTEAEVVAEYRELVPRMRPDLKSLSAKPSFLNHTAADIALDQTDLETYLNTRAHDLPLIRGVLKEAYVAEYGLEPHEQSCLNLLLFLHLDRSSVFRPFGIFSDERYHLVDGNDGIVSGIARRLARPVEMGMSLERLSKTPAGELELKFAGIPSVRRADVVVLALPFAILRHVVLDASLGLSTDKLRAIHELGYGNNAKTMMGFSGQPWLDLHGSNGSAYTDLPELQTTWETNPSRAGTTGILTDYAGGDRGASLHLRPVQAQVAAFLEDLDIVFPGAKERALRQGGSYLAHREHWPTSFFVKGSYTCYRPGQFTGIGGLEGVSAGLLKFAGEHTDSFYSYQGFMEGACLSGIRAASEILTDLKSNR